MSGPNPQTLPPRPPGSARSISTTSVEVAAFSGPLPPPEILRAYEEACQGSSLRIIAMAEDQGKHRREMERELTKAGLEEMRSTFSEARVGQFCTALFLALAFIASGLIAILNGHATAGAVVAGVGGGVGIPPIITVFMRGKSSEPQLNSKTDKSLEQRKPTNRNRKK